LHIEKELVESKIAVLRGRGSANNGAVLGTIALEGPLIKYDLFKELKNSRRGIIYPTISRRVDDLVDRGYLETVGTRTIVVGKRKDESSTYGLTWKGFIASLTIETVAQDILRVLEKNSHLKFPFPRKVPLRIIGEIFTKGELRLIGQALLTGYLRAIPKDLEYIKPEQYLMYLFPAFTEAPKIQEKFEEKDLSRLLQIPEVSEFISKLLNDTEKMLEEPLLGIKEIKKGLSKHLRTKEDESIKTIVSKIG